MLDDAEEEGGGTGEYVGVPSVVYSSKSISMNECLEDADIGLSEGTDMGTNIPEADTPCEAEGS